MKKSDSILRSLFLKSLGHKTRNTGICVGVRFRRITDQRIQADLNEAEAADAARGRSQRRW
jgi:hypothetical protein